MTQNKNQLPHIEDPIDIQNLTLALCTGQAKIQITINDKQIEREIDLRIALLLNNHLKSTHAILSLARYHLVLSHPDTAINIAHAIIKNKSDSSSDTREYIQIQSLNAALVFANASFDYMQILIMLFFEEYISLTNLATRKEVEMKIEKEDIKDWDMAFFSILQRKFHINNQHGWYEKNKNNLPPWLIKDYEELESENSKLKQDYHANPLKHYAISTYEKTNPTNVLGRDYSSMNINDFYSENKNFSVPIGSRRSEMKIDDCRQFLGNYINLSNRLFNKISGSLIVM